MIKTMRYLLIALVTASFFAAQTTRAEVYKWVDENGKVHFTDKPPRQPEVEPEVIEITTSKHVSAAAFPALAKLEPIKNSSSVDAKTVVLEHLSIEYQGNANDASALGRTYRYTREAGLKAARLRQSDKARHRHCRAYPKVT